MATKITWTWLSLKMRYAERAIVAQMGACFGFLADNSCTASCDRSRAPP